MIRRFLGAILLALSPASALAQGAVPSLSINPNQSVIASGAPASVAATTTWTSAVITPTARASVNLQFTAASSVNASVCVNRFADAAATQSIGSNCTNVTAGSFASAVASDGLIYQTYQVSIQNATGGAAAISGVSLIETSSPPSAVLSALNTGVAGSPWSQVLTTQGIIGETPNRTFPVATELTEGATSFASNSTTGTIISRVAKATPGNLYSATAIGLPALSTYHLIIYDSTTFPVPGTALNVARIRECAAFETNGQAHTLFHSIPRSFTTGIVALISSAADCTAWTGSANFTGTVVGGTSLLTAASVTGAIAVGDAVSCTGCNVGQFILSLGTGTGGAGTYNLGSVQPSNLSSVATMTGKGAMVWVDYQ